MINVFTVETQTRMSKYMLFSSRTMIVESIVVSMCLKMKHFL